MGRILAFVCAFSALIVFRSYPVHAITIETVPIGNPGNPSDPNTGKLHGSVGYEYRIGKYEVTTGQYAAFLNAVAATDTYSLWHNGMSFANIAGIARNTVSDATHSYYIYSVIGSPNKPIAYIKWDDAARFCNWLNNGQPIGPEGPGTTETGAYTLNGAMSQAALLAVTRNANAVWSIPSEDEWYKAAYYDPVAGHYWQYATGTNTVPTSAPPGSIPNTANYYDDLTGYAVTGSTTLSNSQNYLTDVGTYTNSASPYGTFDQNGNVQEWNDAIVANGYREARGGLWDPDQGSIYLRASVFNLKIPNEGGYSTGFRVVMVPEPSSVFLMTSSVLVMFMARKWAFPRRRDGL
jgi:formylglycine-generating enzyme